MHDIKALEREWERYRKRKIRPWYIFLSVTLVGLSITLLFLNYQNIYFVKGDINSSKNIKALSVKSVVAKSFKDSNSTSTNTLSQKAPLVLIEDVPILDDNETIKNNKKVDLHIVKTSSSIAYREVERRFLQSHDTEDALFLAKSYYAKGNYAKAEYWALEANKVDDNIEESWLIFAKAKAKQGQINEAIRILTSYIRKSNSVQAKSVLYKIKKDVL